MRHLIWRRKENSESKPIAVYVRRTRLHLAPHAPEVVEIKCVIDREIYG